MFRFTTGIDPHQQRREEGRLPQIKRHREQSPTLFRMSGQHVGYVRLCDKIVLSDGSLRSAQIGERTFSTLASVLAAQTHSPNETQIENVHTTVSTVKGNTCKERMGKR